MTNTHKIYPYIFAAFSCVAVLFSHASFAQDQSPQTFMEQFNKFIMDGKDHDALSLLKTKATDGNAEAACMLGTLSAKGRLIPQSYEVAATWLLPAANTGCVMSPLYLGFMYRDGLGFSKNQKQAENWFRIFYLRIPDAPIERIKLPSGISVIADMEQAKTWFMLSIQNKNPAELYELAQSYQFDSNILNSEEFLIHFMHQAAMAGSSKAQDYIARLKAQNDPRLSLLGFSKRSHTNQSSTIQ